MIVRIAFVSTMIAIAGCSSDEAPSGLHLSVQKWDGAELCWRTLTAADLDPERGVPERSCAGTSMVSTALVSGADRLRVIVDYGDIVFSSGAAVPTPTLTLHADAVTSAVAVGGPRRAANDSRNVYFVGEFRVPSTPVAALRLSARVVDGFAAVVPETFTVEPPSLSLTPEGCSVANCELTGGVDTAVLEVGVTGTLAQAVTLTWSLDGVSQPESLEVNVDQEAPDLRSMRKRIFLKAPRTSRDGVPWVVRAQKGPSTSAPVTLTVSRRRLGLAVEQCDGGQCFLTAGVASASLLVSVPSAAASEEVRVTWTLDGVTQSQSQLITADELGVTPRLLLGRGFVAVPSLPAGTRWTLTARSGAESASSPVITLLAPVLSVSLACATPCVLTTGSAVTLTIAAPAGLQPAVARVLSSVNGRPSAAATVPLTIPDRTAGTATGRLDFVAPTVSDGGIDWQLDTSVDGFAAQTINVRVVAP